MFINGNNNSSLLWCVAVCGNGSAVFSVCPDASFRWFRLGSSEGHPEEWFGSFPGAIVFEPECGRSVNTLACSILLMTYVCGEISRFLTCQYYYNCSFITVLYYTLRFVHFLPSCFCSYWHKYFLYTVLAQFRLQCESVWNINNTYLRQYLPASLWSSFFIYDIYLITVGTYYMLAYMLDWLTQGTFILMKQSAYGMWAM